MIHMYSRPVFPPCVLPSVVICFHVFMILILGPYITCIAFYHVLQSDNQSGSDLPHRASLPLFALPSLRLVDTDSAPSGDTAGKPPVLVLASRLPVS
jgi:hypothetical protein